MRKIQSTSFEIAYFGPADRSAYAPYNRFHYGIVAVDDPVRQTPFLRLVHRSAEEIHTFIGPSLGYATWHYLDKYVFHYKKQRGVMYAS